MQLLLTRSFHLLSPRPPITTTCSPLTPPPTTTELYGATTYLGLWSDVQRSLMSLLPADSVLAGHELLSFRLLQESEGGGVEARFRIRRPRGADADADAGAGEETKCV